MSSCCQTTTDRDLVAQDRSCCSTSTADKGAGAGCCSSSTAS